MMRDFKIFIILSVLNISLIVCNKNKSGEVVMTEEKNKAQIIAEYEKTEFDLFRNPFTLFWKIGLEPVCAYFQNTIWKICKIVIQKLQKHGMAIKELTESSKNFSYGCYPFKLNGANKDGSPRIQRTNRCPYTLESGENLFISHCFTISNSYFVYAAGKISKTTKFNRVNKKYLEEARLVGLATAGPKYIWFFS